MSRLLPALALFFFLLYNEEVYGVIQRIAFGQGTNLKTTFYMFMI